MHLNISMVLDIYYLHFLHFIINIKFNFIKDFIIIIKIIYY